MAERGICKLCQTEKDLQISHYMPSALYPKKAKLQFATGTGCFTEFEHVKAPLLCLECEELFDQNGESEVLLRIAPKLRKRFPLHEKLRVAHAREERPSVKRFAGYEIGLDMDKFAYFTLSLVWRGAVHSWVKPDGTLTTPLILGEFEEAIRLYLLGKAPFPPDAAVIVIVCSDKVSRESWFPPSLFPESEYLDFGMHALGVYFRAMLGRNIPQFFREQSCSSPRKCIFYGDCERRTREYFEALHGMPKL